MIYPCSLKYRYITDSWYLDTEKSGGNSVPISISVKEISFKISYSQYKNSLMDDRKMLVTAVCETKKGASLLVEKDIVLQDPFLIIKVKAGPLCVSRKKC